LKERAEIRRFGGSGQRPSASREKFGRIVTDFEGSERYWGAKKHATFLQYLVKMRREGLKRGKKRKDFI